MRLGEKIVEVARHRGLNLRQVAEKAGIPYDTLRGYTKKTGNRVPSAPDGINLAKALSVPTDWLYDDLQGPAIPPRLAPPPFRIAPWPPDGITWDEVMIAIARYILDLHTAHLPRTEAKMPTAKVLEQLFEWLKDPSVRPEGYPNTDDELRRRGGP